LKNAEKTEKATAQGFYPIGSGKGFTLDNWQTFCNTPSRQIRHNPGGFVLPLFDNPV